MVKDSIKRCSSLRLVERDQRLPNYAQSTISFHQHSSAKYDKVSPEPKFKAGTERRLTRPVSSKLIRPNSCNSNKETKERYKVKSAKESHSLIDLYQTPKKEIEYITSRGRSSGFGMPTLKKYFVDSKELVEDTAGLIRQVEEEKELEEFQESIDNFKLKLASNDGELNLKVKDIEHLIDHHCFIFHKLQNKSKLNNRLIKNVLELNNAVSVKYSDQRKEIELYQKEINYLKNQLNTDNTNKFKGYSDIFQDLPLEENNELIFKSKELPSSPGRIYGGSSFFENFYDSNTKINH